VTLEGVARDVQALQRMSRVRSIEVMEKLVLDHRLACVEPECFVCGALDCRENAFLHYSAEGCPACGETNARV
jgi:hypothetical protein